MARRALRWMFRQPWSAALAGLFVIAVGITNAVRMHDGLPNWVLTGLGVFALLGAIVARIKTGTWQQKPQAQPDDDAAGK